MIGQARKLGPREQQLRALKEAKATRRAATTPNPAPAAPAKPKETTMAKKTKTKAAARGRAARKADKAKKTAAPKAPTVAQPGKDGKTISEIAREQILAGKTNQEALDAVKKAHPEGNTNIGNISWYRNDLRKKGKLPPTEAAAAG